MVYRWLFRPLLMLLPAEIAHHLVFVCLRFAGAIPGGTVLLRALFRRADPRLGVRAWGLDFSSPLGLAAGFDKSAEAISALSAIGFGALEVGTVTREPQPGNPKPRLFRLPRDRALINRMGFNNDGAAVVATRLRGPRAIPLGVNIGKTKRVAESEILDDYLASARELAPHADYLVVNVSSPNTPGLRGLQAVEQLRPLLAGVQHVVRQSGKRVPLLVKIAPDLSDDDVDDVAALVQELAIDGVIATNTTVGRSGLVTSAAEVAACGEGGLSGRPLRARSLEVLRRLRARVGSECVLIASGGIETADDAWERICAGATLVQIYTAMIYEGPGLVKRMNRELTQRVTAAGFATIQEAIGSSRA